MSFYNMVHGSNPTGGAILAALGLKKSDVGRFRDCFVSEGKIAVYTRNGGGNRAEYEDVFGNLRKHPHYLTDEDDDFDSTYATIYFSFPIEFEDELKSLESGKFDPSQRWIDAISAIEGIK